MGVLCPLCPWVGFVLDKQDVPKTEVDFPAVSMTKYAVRITRGGRGCAIRIVLLQCTSSVVSSASSLPRATKHPQDTSPGWPGRVENEAARGAMHALSCAAGWRGPQDVEVRATLGAGLEAGVPELKACSPMHSWSVSWTQAPGSSGLACLKESRPIALTSSQGWPLDWDPFKVFPAWRGGWVSIQ